MQKIALRAAPVVLVLIGLILLYAGSQRAVTIVIDGIPQTVHTRALTARAALAEIGLPTSPQDRIGPSGLLGWNPVVSVERARQVQLYLPVNPAEPEKNVSMPFLSADRRPANLLLSAGFHLFPGDRVLLNGRLLDPSAQLPPMPSYLLQLIPATQLTLQENGAARTVWGTGPGPAGVLWSAGVRLSSLDALSVPPGEPVPPGQPVTIARAAPIKIQFDGQEIEVAVSAGTVGAALAAAGVSLQGDDYSQPAEDQPVPPDSAIKVVRVREEVLLEQSTVPYETEFVADPETELDQRSVVQAGQLGVKVTRVRLRYEDGQEIDRQAEAEWVATEPKNEVLGYGTKVVVRTLDTPDGPIEYWRAVTVYATSYSPCGLGDPSTTKCYYGTSYGLPVKRGVIGVTKYWYRDMAGQSVYVPGYGPGVIADIGAGVPGEKWIDLGFTDEELELWHHYVTLYFLTPVPPNIPWILP